MLINGALTHASHLGHAIHGRLRKALLNEDFSRPEQDTLAFSLRKTQFRKHYSPLDKLRQDTLMWPESKLVSLLSVNYVTR